MNDFSQLMEFLVTEEYEKSLEYRQKHKSGIIDFDNVTKLEIIKKIWENVIENKSLTISAGKIEVSNKSSSNELFNGAEMSDGERAIFYFIGEVLCVPNNSLIIIDEPENHLHKSILVRLWNAIESSRPDCTFLYITHSLDFAVSRNNSQIIWVKDMPKKDEWEYELLSENDSKIDDVKLEILGNRQKVLLVEGNTDSRLYSAIFKDYNIISVGGCDKVIEITKSYKNKCLQDKHYCEVKGIIDRDRRSDEAIKKLNKNNIFCLEVAEVENLFLLPEVIKIVAKKQDKMNLYDEIIGCVQEKIFLFLSDNIDSQALLFTQYQIQNKIFESVHEKSQKIEEYKEKINDLSKLNSDVDFVYKEVISRLQSIIDNRNYCEALKMINAKCLFSHTGLEKYFHLNKKEYTNYVLCLFNDTDVSEELCNIFKNYVRID